MSSLTEATANSGFLSKERIIAGEGFNRWLVPPAALAIHLCIGMAYGFSVFWKPLGNALLGPDGAPLAARPEVLVVGPEHARVFADDGWDRGRVLAELHQRMHYPGSELIHGAGGIAEGVPAGLKDLTLPKFKPDGILLVHAGGGAGLFSQVIGGWVNGAMGSTPVTREVTG